MQAKLSNDIWGSSFKVTLCSEYLGIFTPGMQVNNAFSTIWNHILVKLNDYLWQSQRSAEDVWTSS